MIKAGFGSRESEFGARRTGYLLGALVLGHVILISAQVQTRSGVRVLEAVTFGAFSEVQRGVSRAFGGVRGVWEGYVALRGLHAENETLRTRVAELELKLQEQRALAQRSESLARTLDLRAQVKMSTVAAQVIAVDPTPWFRTATIDKGFRHGLRRDLAVIAPAGVVGRVVGEPAPNAAKVQLLIDRNAAAGAMIERSRAGGVISGHDGDPPLLMQYVSNLADVQAGDTVVTSGIDGIYPKGFVVGRVEQVERGAGLYKTIKVRPALDFSGLEDVLVVLVPGISQPTAGGEAAPSSRPRAGSQAEAKR